MKTYDNVFAQVVAPESLFVAWEEFRVGKGKRFDVRQFEYSLEQHIFQLHRELVSKRYRHGVYHSFTIADPKPRHIHKSTVRDRVVHHAVFTALNRIFEPTFVADSFSCRVDKGTHKGVARVQQMIRKVSRNGTQPCYALKCDIKKFFDSVDHDILLAMLNQRITDSDLRWLLKEIIESYVAPYSRERERERERVNALPRAGIPIGNLTSQIFANIYMNEFDQFVKHELRVKNYARYTDDFIVIADSSAYLERLLPSMADFLSQRLALELHPDKVTIRSFHRGVDFLGYVIFPHHRVLRTRTRKRMMKKLTQRAEQQRHGSISEYAFNQTLQSYLGVLSHANAFKLSRDVKNKFWF